MGCGPGTEMSTLLVLDGGAGDARRIRLALERTAAQLQEARKNSNAVTTLILGNVVGPPSLGAASEAVALDYR